MGDLTKFDVYKIIDTNIHGYIFSILDESEGEPTYHYYIITLDSLKRPTINKLNNTIEILNTAKIKLAPVPHENPEILNFINLIKTTILTEKETSLNNAFFNGINENDIKLMRQFH